MLVECYNFQQGSKSLSLWLTLKTSTLCFAVVTACCGMNFSAKIKSKKIFKLSKNIEKC